MQRLFKSASFAAHAKMVTFICICYGRHITHRSSHQRFIIKKVLSKIPQTSQKNTCARASFLIKLQASTFNFILKDTLTLLFSCYFTKFIKASFFLKKHWLTASERYEKLFDIIYIEPRMFWKMFTICCILNEIPFLQQGGSVGKKGLLGIPPCLATI